MTKRCFGFGSALTRSRWRCSLGAGPRLRDAVRLSPSINSGDAAPLSRAAAHAASHSQAASSPALAVARRRA